MGAPPEPWHGQELLTAQVEGGTAGGEHLEGGTARQQGGDQLPDRAQQVLAVVKHQEPLLASQAGRDDVGDRAIRARRDL